MTISEAKWQCLRAQTAPIDDEECAKQLPCIDMNYGTTQQTAEDNVTTPTPQTDGHNDTTPGVNTTNVWSNMTISGADTTTQWTGSPQAVQSDTGPTELTANPSLLIIIVSIIGLVLVITLVGTLAGSEWF
jgi:hypothetical protein